MQERPKTRSPRIPLERIISGHKTHDVQKQYLDSRLIWLSLLVYYRCNIAPSVASYTCSVHINTWAIQNNEKSMFSLYKCPPHCVVNITVAWVSRGISRLFFAEGSNHGIGHLESSYSWSTKPAWICCVNVLFLR